jgi:cholesterol oxidase
VVVSCCFGSHIDLARACQGDAQFRRGREEKYARGENGEIVMAKTAVKENAAAENAGASGQSAIGVAVDVAVIGSGFGGAAVACRLAQAGKSVAVLEQGREFPSPRVDYDQTGHGLSTIRYGHIWVDVGAGMSVVRGIGVGGGSLHYFGVRLRTDQRIFDNPRWPKVINRKTLDPYYDVAGDMLKAAPTQPNPVLGPPAHGAAFITAASNCRRCKTTPEYVPIAVHTGAEPAQTPSGIQQTRCVFCGQCLIGCPPSQSFTGNVNARALLTLNYLAVAQQYGARIFPLHRVHVVRQAQGGFEIDIRVIAEDTLVEEDERLAPGIVRAKQVVVAAGTMGTVEILLKSKAAGALPQLSGRLGHWFSGNGDFLIPKTINTPQNLQPTAGPTITAGADFSTKDLAIFIEDLGVIPFAEALMGTRALTARAPDPHQLGYLGMGSDAANGELRLHNGLIRLYWDPADSLPLYREITACLRELSQQLGGDYQMPATYNPVIGTGLFTAHPLGGAVVADSIEGGVCDPQGAVFGVPGLYVADASLIPTALATNPSYTITALAERVAFWMLHGREMKSGDKETPRNS